MLAFSVIIMTHGLLSLALDRDVIPDPGAGSLVVIAMHGTTTAIIFVSVLAGLTPERRGNPQLPLAILAGAAVYALTPAAGALAYAIVIERLLSLAPFLLGHLLSPFVLASAITTTLVILALPLLDRMEARPR